MGHIGNGPHPLMRDIMDAVNELRPEEFLKIVYSDKGIDVTKDQIHVGSAALKLTTKIGILWVPFDAISSISISRR
jgi:hypothetical protein